MATTRKRTKLVLQSAVLLIPYLLISATEAALHVWRDVEKYGQAFARGWRERSG